MCTQRGAPWKASKTILRPLIQATRPRICQKLKEVRAYDGMQLPPEDWAVIRSIGFRRDGLRRTTVAAARRPMQFLVSEVQMPSIMVTAPVRQPPPPAYSSAVSSPFTERWRHLRSTKVRPGTKLRRDCYHPNNNIMEVTVRSGLLWLIGVPIPLIIILWLVTGHA